MTIRKLVGTLENKGPYIDLWKTKAHTLTSQQATGSTGTEPNMLIRVILMP